MPHDALKIVSLVSIGAHPTSGRARRADQDARAVELGLRLAGPRLRVLHAGNPHEEALRAYLGMGLDELIVLEQGPQDDALHSLGDFLRESGAQMVVVNRLMKDPAFSRVKKEEQDFIKALPEIEHLSRAIALDERARAEAGRGR